MKPISLGKTVNKEEEETGGSSKEVSGLPGFVEYRSDQPRLLIVLPDRVEYAFIGLLPIVFSDRRCG